MYINAFILCGIAMWLVRKKDYSFAQTNQNSALLHFYSVYFATHESLQGREKHFQMTKIQHPHTFQGFHFMYSSVTVSYVAILSRNILLSSSHTSFIRQHIPQNMSIEWDKINVEMGNQYSELHTSWKTANKYQKHKIMYLELLRNFQRYFKVYIILCYKLRFCFFDKCREALLICKLIKSSSKSIV